MERLYKNENDPFQIKHLSTGATVLYIQPFDNTGQVKSYFTTKLGGVSAGDYATLNFGRMTKDSPENIDENRRRVFQGLGLADPVLVFPQQVHKAEIACVTADDLAGGRKNITFPDTDAVITKEKNVVLTSLHADCIPVYLFDPVNGVIGMVHAGWRGTQAQISAKTAKKMVDELGAQYQTMKAAIGPGISKCCFETGPEVYEAFRQVTPNMDEMAVGQPNGKYYIDLKEINKRQLRALGINDIVVTDYCTVCSSQLFFSHRRENGITGRMGGGLCLTDIFSIAIDGPSGSGKSTTAKNLAKVLGVEYIDTGSMYRAVAYKAQKNNVPIEDEAIGKMLESTEIDFINGDIYLDGVLINDYIRTLEISTLASEVSKLPSCRARLVDIQRRIAATKSVVMDGRDIGTNVLSNSKYKFFITASLANRCKRRYEELKSKGQELTYEDVLKDLKQRDINDTTRALNPLKKAEDAIEISTDEMNEEAVVDILVKMIAEKK